MPTNLQVCHKRYDYFASFVYVDLLIASTRNSCQRIMPNIVDLDFDIPAIATGATCHYWFN